LLLVVAGILATQALMRTVLTSRAESRIPAQFEAAHAALAQYVATARRLPCPANPGVDDGDAEPVAASATCTYPGGTLPWRTIGLAREEAVDPWGGKISYRVYTGNAGSLTQAGGASMVECDIGDTGAATALVGNAGRLCNPAALVTYRDTDPANFLAGKGFTVNDLGTAKTGVAYVLVSHGATGRGAYTTSGVQKDLPPAGDELTNTGLTGPYAIKAFSGSGSDPGSAAHFDDFLAYRGIEELVRAAGLYARDWPETVTTSTSVTFNQATVEAAVGASVTPGSGVGQVTVNFTGVVAAAIDSAGNPVEITYATSGSNEGIGVAGGGSAMVQSSASEKVRLTVERINGRFGATLVDFGTYGGEPYIELVEFRFFNNGTQVGSARYGIACHADGGLASFDISVGAAYDRVDVTPIPAYNTDTGMFTGITAFLLGSVKTCPSPAAQCRTDQWLAGNACSYL